MPDAAVTAPPAPATAPPPAAWRLDLLRVVPGLKWLVTRRWFQFAMIFPNLLLFYFFLLAGTFGSPIGNRNIIIIFVWILWWFVLITLLVPFVSRIWCTVCPFPFFGEWVQRRALIGVRSVDVKDAAQKKGGPGTVIGRNRYFGRNWRWPKALSNIWVQNFGFLALCTFSVALVTRPIVSVLVLGGLFVIATVLHLLFRQRAFCNYVCPVSGFLSLYAMTSTLEVRARDADVCARCKDKGCLAGGETGWGCPWMMYPSKMDRNNYCGLCMECVKTCPHDNMTLRLRPFCSDTRIKGYDESWKAFIMLTLAFAYSINLLGPYGVLKDSANVSETGQWGRFALYALGLWAAALLVLPALFWGAVRLGRWWSGEAGQAPKDIFCNFSFVMVPLGLLAWIAFSVPLVMVNGSYIISVVSDPMGYGWDLFGTANFPWSPLWPAWIPHLQGVLLGVGLLVALRVGYRYAARTWGEGAPALRAFAPLAVLLTAITCGFFRLYAG